MFSKTFYFFALCLALPLITIPLTTISLSAPLFFLLFIHIIGEPAKASLRQYRVWIILAVAMWAGILISTIANGLLSGSIDLVQGGLQTVFRYLYWFIVFVVAMFIASRENILRSTVIVLGVGIFALALFRIGEVMVYGNLGAWTGTKLLPQNTYGFLFSMFSPCLLFLAISKRYWLLGIGGYATVLMAVGANGSRGSWVAIAIGIFVILLILAVYRSRAFVGALLLGATLVAVLALSSADIPDLPRVVEQRFESLDALERDKSYLVRQVMNQKSLRLFAESPIIGVGASRFRESDVPLDVPYLLSGSFTFYRSSAHNSYLGFLAENGLLGALPFAILLILLLVGGARAAVFSVARRDYLALFVFTSFVQMSVHMWAINSLTNTGNWFLYGLVGATIGIHRQRQRDGEKT
jgi:O-antigen ligase